MNNKQLNILGDMDFLIYAVGFAVKDEEPLEYALATIRTAIRNIYDRFPERKDTKLFLSGKNNFRDKLGTLKVYKGNRDPAMRPKYYDELRQYLIDYHGAVVVNGMEAEDACGIEQWKHKDKSTVIVGVDKDLNMIPGYHFNPKKNTLEYISLEKANYTFWHQVLMGDQVDNIGGLPGVGPKTASKILAGANGWVGMSDAVRKAYDKEFGDRGPAVLYETAKLIWILREEGRTFDGTYIN